MNNEESKNIVVTMRCIDMASPINDVDKIECDKCGEMTWISHSFRGKRIDEVICQKCFFEKNSGEDFCAAVTETCIDEAIDHIERLYGRRHTREEMLKAMEDKIGKKIHIINI